jgi:hypothetical protein
MVKVRVYFEGIGMEDCPYDFPSVPRVGEYLDIPWPGDATSRSFYKVVGVVYRPTDESDQVEITVVPHASVTPEDGPHVV